ncbi:uncharacterized protein LOC143053992 isoform X2 [Mytilus galloprovincialis]|uniref:uncharacterized protein LOC143053992 isoform X2 n=1 Tax=Mytilus galloprovincialis TaxID=29158 RepID=UPI003F7C338B
MEIMLVLLKQFVDCVEKNYLELTVLNMLRRSTLLKTNTKIAEAEILPPKRKREQNRLQNNRSRHSFVQWMAAFESSRTRSVLINISFKAAVNIS